jgi:myo-inositol-1(or 4)-monophosphatase
MAAIDVDDDRLLAIALAAAQAAGALLLDRFNLPATGIERKSSSTDMVSDADRDAESLIRRLIGDARPGDGVLGEEAGSAEGASGLRWVVDPLDGTTNYLYRHPVWAVSVACEDADGARVGVVYQPCLGETFTAIRGRGAQLNQRPIAVSEMSDLGRSLIGTGFSYVPQVRTDQARALVEILPRVRDVRRGGSAAIDLAWVACGRLDGYYELGTRHWDRAAGVLLVREAGGVTAMLDPVGQSGDGVLAANPELHVQLSRLVAAALLH